jgi:hypothetical protein
VDLTKILPSSKGEHIPPCEIYVDEEGDWYHRQNKILRKDILHLFYENLHLDQNGVFFIDWKGNQCTLDVADTPFVISRVDRKTLGNSDQEGIFLSLKHFADQEFLDPSTLQVGEDNILYCRIRGGALPARFSRPAYYQMAEWIEEDLQTGDFYLELNGKHYVVEFASHS